MALWFGAIVNKLTTRIYKLKVCTDCSAQDLVEYALAAGMVAMAGVAAMPVLSGAVNGVFSKIGSTIMANL